MQRVFCTHVGSIFFVLGMICLTSFVHGFMFDFSILNVCICTRVDSISFVLSMVRVTIYIHDLFVNRSFTFNTSRRSKTMLHA